MTEQPDWADNPTYWLRQLQDTGILWAINRYIFHPRGLTFALGLDRDKSPEPYCFVMGGDGSEIVQFDETENDEFQVFEGFIAYLQGRNPEFQPNGLRPSEH